MSVTTTQNGQPDSPAPPPPDDAAAHQSPLAKEYAKAIRKNVVSFEQVVAAAFGRRPANLDRAGLLPLETPTDDASLYYYAAIAFFAGFSERWAQSTLKNAIPLSEQPTPGVDPQPPAALPGQKPA
jgi:hypothetical protein